MIKLNYYIEKCLGVKNGKEKADSSTGYEKTDSSTEYKSSGPIYQGHVI
tara:strand:- start:745 stop:891 length:147 start_codon:yes stop_codon:yes gene_type:complete